MKAPFGIPIVLLCLFLPVLELDGREIAEDEVTVGMVADDLKNGNPRLAWKHSIPLLKSQPKSAEAHALYGLALIDCGEYEKAEAELKCALSLDPNIPEAHLGIGKLIFEKGDRSKAVDHLYKAASTSHLKYMTYELLGIYLSYLDRHGEAKKVLDKALKEIAELTEEEKTYFKNTIAIYSGYGKRKLYQIPEDFRSTRLTFTNSEGHILAPIKANGVDIGITHLDTGGTGGLTISADWAEKLNLQIIGKRIGRNVAKELKADVALLDEIRIGDLVITNVPVNLYEGYNFHGKCSGNLGKEVLQRLNMTIDFTNSELTFFNPAFPELQTAQIDKEKASEIIPFFNLNFIIVRASVNGHEAQPFILDTGAGIVVFHEEYYLETLQPHKDKRGNRKPQGPKPFNVDSILLGGRNYKKILSIALDLNDLYRFAKVYYPGILGNPLFQSSKLHFNFAESFLVIEDAR